MPPATAELEPLQNAAAAAPVPLALSAAAVLTKTQNILLVLGGVGFLHIARPLVLPIVLACIIAMTLKPLIRWLSHCRIRPALGAAIVLSLFGTAIGIGFVKLGPPAVAWVNNTPAHMAQLRHRVQKMLPPSARFGLAAAAVNNLGATEAEQNRPPMVEVKDNHGSTAV